MNEYTVDIIARMVDDNNKAIINAIDYVCAGIMDWEELSEVIKNEILDYEEANA